MTYEKIALLRSLATRPCRDIAPTVQRMLDELLAAGYVAHDNASGWSATAAGCRAVESSRELSLHGRGE